MFMLRTFSCVCVLASVACTNRAAPTPAADAKATKTPSKAERGRQLVAIGGCNDCHTPMQFDPKLGMPVPQMERLLSGHPAGAPGPASSVSGHDQAVIGPTFTSFRVPFGVVYSANLTPDAETGIGTWTEAQFIGALRSGHHKGEGRPILPPMPWMALGAQGDEDLSAMFAYLKSIPAIRNAVPAPDVPPQALEQLEASYAKLKGSVARAEP